MATAAVSIPQQVPHMPIPHVPRVRPPRILKGTPSPNSVPQPPGRPPSGKVWAQGRWRERGSNSAKFIRQKQSRQVEKALRHDTHGQNIYAYAHIRTHQVVYSLTRIMSNTKILPQLIYHGKKTVPAALRRDHWTPYFSLHFLPNEYGASSGLLAYHQLRELSTQRQLAPPEDMVITTQEDIDRIKARYDPIDLANAIENKSKDLKLPKVGQLLPKKLRAKRLMSQKSTAVADLAFVLGLQAEGPDPDEAARLKEERRKKWWNNISKGAKSRARKRAKLEEGKEEQLEKRRQMAMKAEGGALGLKPDAANRIAMEYHDRLIRYDNLLALAEEGRRIEKEKIAINNGQEEEGKGTVEGGVSGSFMAAERADSEGLQDRPTKQRADADSAEAPRPFAASLVAARVAVKKPMGPREIRVLWADLRDAAYAEKWPETVIHAELERKAVVKKAQENSRPRVESSSVHVIGGQKGSGWYLDPVESAQLKKEVVEPRRARERKDFALFEESLDHERERQQERQRERERTLVEIEETRTEMKSLEDEYDRMRKAFDPTHREEAGFKRSLVEGGDWADDADAEGSSASLDEHERRQDAAERLRKTGIEVETPRRGLLARVKRIFVR